MKLSTPLLPTICKDKLEHSNSVLTVGSCFSENIGNKLIENKFDVLNNPFGTLFDPLSITRILTYCLENKEPADNTYVLSQGVSKNLEFHSSFAGKSKDELQLKIKSSLVSGAKFLKRTNWLIITLGTAHVYQYLKSNSFIANCQKLPAREFERSLLSADAIFDNINSFIEALRKINPLVKIIVTVSPVRHLSIGLDENSLSKATLRIACDQLTRQNEHVYYHPAFEIMLDDLRDYRFYKDDLIHPTDLAIEYIWQHFQDTFLSEPTKEMILHWQSIQKSMRHKPFNPQTDDHHKFLKKILIELTKLQGVLKVDHEIAEIERQLEDMPNLP